MRNRSLFIVAANIVTMLPVATWATSLQPSAGVYGETDYVLSAKAASGQTCPFTAKSTMFDTFIYPGPGKTGGSVYRYYNDPGFLEISTVTYTTAFPAAGVKTWSTAGTSALVPAVSGGTGIFKTTFVVTFVDANSFIANATLHLYTSANVLKCTVTMQSTYVRTGS